jgi:hypothetical protein
MLAYGIRDRLALNCCGDNVCASKVLCVASQQLYGGFPHCQLTAIHFQKMTCCLR